MMNDLVLRPARPEDHEFVWDLYQSTMADYVREGLGLDDGQQRANFESRTDLTRTQIVMRAAERIGVLVVVEMPWGTLVQWMGILPVLQGQGIGTFLLRSLMEERARQGRMVGLTVLKCNPARKLYLRLGFRIVSTNGTHYRMATDRKRPPPMG